MRRLSSLFAIFLMILGTVSIHGKIFDPNAPNQGYWITLGIGSGNIHGIGRMGGSFTLTRKFNRNLLTLRIVGLVRPFSESMYDTAGDFGLLYGRVLTNPEMKYYVSVGIGISRTEVGVRYDDVTTIGIPLEVQFFPIPLLGFYGFVNINSAQIFSGFTICLRLGK